MKSFRQRAFVVFLGLAALGFVAVLVPLAFPLFWSLVLALLFTPLYQAIRKRTHRPSLSAAAVLVVVLITVILPLVLAAAILLEQAVEMYAQVRDSDLIQEKTQNFMDYIGGHPILSMLGLSEQDLISRFYGMLGGVSKFIVTYLTQITQNLILLVINFIITLYCFFFILRDRDRIVCGALGIFEDGIGDKLYARFTSTARATLKSTLIIGGLQSAMGGLLFWAVGVHAAFVWAVLMFIASLIPSLGPAIIWAPAGLLLLLTGHTAQGLIVLGIGTVVISSVDNVLRPWLVGKDIELHPLTVFVTSIGGLIVFGLSGFLIGPMIAALLITLWDLYRDHYHGLDPA